MNFHRYRSGRGWTVLDDGRILADAPSDLRGIVSDKPWTATEAFEYRTKGDPASMRTLLVDYRGEFVEASDLFSIPVYVLAAMIGIEATRLKGDRLRFDPRSIRFEPGYRDDLRTPDRVSPGLAQTLLSTAAEVLPRTPLPQDRLTREDLFVPRYSILLGAAYIRKQMDRVEDDEVDLPGDDPLLNACAAYNAGSVRFDASSPFHLKTYAEGRSEKFIAYNNDAIAALDGLAGYGVTR